MAHVSECQLQLLAARDGHGQLLHNAFLQQLLPSELLHMFKNALRAGHVDGVVRRKPIVGGSHPAGGFPDTAADGKAGDGGAGNAVNVPTDLEVITDMFALILRLKYRVGGKIADGVHVGFDVIQYLDACQFVIQINACQHVDGCAETSLLGGGVRCQENITYQCLRAGVRVGLVTAIHWWFAGLFGKRICFGHDLGQPLRLHLGGKWGSDRIAFNGLAWWLRCGQ